MNVGADLDTFMYSTTTTVSGKCMPSVEVQTPPY